VSAGPPTAGSSSGSTPGRPQLGSHRDFSTHAANASRSRLPDFWLFSG
jgi:hypothetical protein